MATAVTCTSAGVTLEAAYTALGSTAQLHAARSDEAGLPSPEARLPEARAQALPQVAKCKVAAGLGYGASG